jgi:TonB family protein
VELRVCAKSGLRPGKYCNDTDERRFLESETPDGRCTACKAPEPEPVKHHDDRANEQREAVLVRDATPDLDSLREQGVEGTFTVVVRYTVGESGRVSDASVSRSSGNDALDDAVLRAVRRYRYRPATVGGSARSVQLTRSIRVQLSQ